MHPFVLSDYENYYPKGKKEAPKGDGSNKDSKQESDTDGQWNFQDGTFKQLQNFLGPLLLLGLMFSSLSSSSSDQKEVVFIPFQPNWPSSVFNRSLICLL
ncbi:unnamed protein product [Triticum turgidum subsp. durum]|uniref:Uncharacterized protein n=1 Tax=Triticum turgidum subsp. durum TaxID=4567 RepID=A0A9R0QCZ1_TRITD|nr:unnamed protein product [Triticum turgidum subsp. durum]